MTKREIQQIISRKMPGFHVVSSKVIESDAPRAESADATTPSLEQLRAKYLKRSSRASELEDSAATLLRPNSSKAEDIMVVVEPDAPRKRYAHRKSVILSSAGRLIGSQG